MIARDALIVLATAGALGLAACADNDTAPAAASTQTGISTSGPSTSPGAPNPGATGSDTTAPQTAKPTNPEAPPVRPGGP